MWFPTGHQLRFAIISCLVASVAAQGGDEFDCSSNFFALEQSLLQSTDNRFHLLQSFYPPRQAHPVLLRVNYTFDGVDNSTQMWFWSVSEFYLIQPLEIFQFTSLLFSDMPYRSGQVSLVLAGNCSLTPQEHLQLLTTKVSKVLKVTIAPDYRKSGITIRNCNSCSCF